MKLQFADSQKPLDIDLSSFAPDLFFIGARIEAKSHSRVLEIIGQCFHCGTIQKPLADQSLDEMFSWCCEAAERESILVRQAQNKCGTCGEYSRRSVTHPACEEMEKANAQFEQFWADTH